MYPCTRTNPTPAAVQPLHVFRGLVFLVLQKEISHLLPLNTPVEQEMDGEGANAAAPAGRRGPAPRHSTLRERKEFFIDNLLVRVRLIIEIIMNSLFQVALSLRSSAGDGRRGRECGARRPGARYARTSPPRDVS